MTTLVVALVVFASMLIEAAVSRRHERELRAIGAVEPRRDVYRVMQAAYPAAFLLMIGEGVWRRAAVDEVFWAGATVFLAAKALKFWAIRTLGMRWAFRVLVPPRSAPIRSGPYRWLRHPNYVAVAGELLGTAMMMRAFVTGPIATAGFVALMAARIRVEEHALNTLGAGLPDKH